MSRTKVAINGFGRIGRAAARLILTTYKDKLDLVAINDPSDRQLTAHLFKYDSNYGTFSEDVSIDGEFFVVGGERVRSFTTRNIEDLPWGDLGVDIVLECTGVFRTAETCQRHLDQGAKKVLLSAPAKSDGFRTIVLGVNDEELQDSDVLVSNASCTTNCLAPVVKVLDEHFGIQSGLMTTIHAYTNDQRILDVGHKDLRRARSAGQSMIPTTTGAAKAVGLVYPKLKGKLNGGAVRVPTPTVSLVDLTVTVDKATTKEEVNAIFAECEKKNPDIFGLSTAPLVSKDFQGDGRSSIVDADQTLAIDNTIKVMSWYDNEWGYTRRLLDLACMMV